MRFAHLAFAPIVLLAACSSSSSGGSSSAQPGDDAGAATAPVSIASQPYTLQPGDEKYYCYATTLQEDTVVTGFAPTYGDGTHHLLLAYTIAAEPDGFSECPVLIKTTWIPMFGGGKGTNPLALPTGAGMKLQKGQQILLQLHLQNATLNPITASTSVEMTTQDPAKPVDPAGIFGMFNKQITIPPNSVDYPESMTCKSDKKMKVFAALGHMHKHGTHISLTNSATGASIYDSDWHFDVQPTFPLDLDVNPGDSFGLECQYENTGTDPITYGESSDNEMCGFIFYYTTFDVLDGCVQD